MGNYQMSDDNISNYLAGGVDSKAHPLDRFTHKVVTNLLMRGAIPWLVSCLEKYTEEEFHMRMADPYFDFIDDWWSHHPKRYEAFIRGAKKMRHRFNFDVAAITDRVIFVLGQKAGWTVYPQEVNKLRDTIQRVGEEIYS